MNKSFLTQGCKIISTIGYDQPIADMTIEKSNMNGELIFQSTKKLFHRNREVPLRYCLIISPILLAVLLVGFARYFYGRVTHQF
jgi:hypothetical protein